MKKLNKKNTVSAKALMKFREIYIKTELNQNKAKAQLAIYDSLFHKLNDTKKAHRDLKVILVKNKSISDKELLNIASRKAYLKSSIAILQNKLLK